MTATITIGAAPRRTAEEEAHRKIIEQSLLPMLCGAELGTNRSTQPGVGRTVVGSNSPELLMRPGRHYPNYFVFRRNQIFSRSEADLAKAFMAEMEAILPQYDQRYFNDLVKASVRRAIARSLGYHNPELLLQVIDQFDRLSAQTYERQRITAAVGLNDVDRDSGVRITEVWEEDFSKVLTSGVDTMLIVSPSGSLYQFEVIDKSVSLSFAPFHLRLIAEWTTPSRLGVVLNRNGEILIFRNKQLSFARRRGKWIHFVHEPVIAQMGRIGSAELRTKVYETCLDVSFSRTGGCIALIKSTHAAALRRDKIIADKDVLAFEQSCKSKAVRWLIEKSGQYNPAFFQNLPRKLRQELAAIDGAMVIDHTGRLLAVGAIVRVDGGSEAGARRAAAKKLSQYGLGIKISADGEIIGFTSESAGGNPQPKTVFVFG